jgi:transcriptional regulator with XRE-family HTH domain
VNKTLVNIMQDASIRKALGQRIKQLRKQKGWTQKELANRIDASHAQLNKYESGQNTPPIDRLILLAEVLDTSVDHLIGGHHNAKPPIHNTRLIQRFQTIEGFDKEERELVIQVLDAMIAKHNMATTLKAMEG